MTQLQLSAIGLLAGALILALGAVALEVLIKRREIQTNDRIVAALIPWVYTAVLAGEKAALWGMENADAVLGSTDKKLVADSLYDILPPVITVPNTGIIIPIATVKAIIPREDFEHLVSQAADAAHGFIDRQEDYLRAQVAALAPKG